MKSAARKTLATGFNPELYRDAFGRIEIIEVLALRMLSICAGRRHVETTRGYSDTPVHDYSDTLGRLDTLEDYADRMKRLCEERRLKDEHEFEVSVRPPQLEQAPPSTHPPATPRGTPGAQDRPDTRRMGPDPQA